MGGLLAVLTLRFVEPLVTHQPSSAGNIVGTFYRQTFLRSQRWCVSAPAYPSPVTFRVCCVSQRKNLAARNIVPCRFCVLFILFERERQRSSDLSSSSSVLKYHRGFTRGPPSSLSNVSAKKWRSSDSHGRFLGQPNSRLYYWY